MKKKFQGILTLLICAALSGVSLKANALAYSIAYDNVFGLQIISDPLIPTSDIDSFTAISGADALLNGAGDLVNPPNSDSFGGPVDATIAYGAGSVFPGLAPANNEMTAQGQGGNYVYGDAQVSSTSLSQPSLFVPVSPTGEPNQAWSISEGFVATNGSADASGINAFTTGFTLQDDSQLSFVFNAAPYMFVELGSNAVGSATANLDVTFTITSSGGNTVFEWTPDGALGSGITGGTELLDPYSLNASIAVTESGSLGEYDPLGLFAAPSGLINPPLYGFYSASTDLLSAGTYTISFDSVTTSNILTREIEGQIPLPGALSLTMLGLAGIRWSRRDKAQA